MADSRRFRILLSSALQCWCADFGAAEITLCAYFHNLAIGAGDDSPPRGGCDSFTHGDSGAASWGPPAADEGDHDMASIRGIAREQGDATPVDEGEGPEVPAAWSELMDTGSRIIAGKRQRLVQMVLQGFRPTAAMYADADTNEGEIHRAAIASTSAPA